MEPPLYQGTAEYDGSWWVVHFTDLPHGTVHTQGRTWTKAHLMALDAVALHLEVDPCDIEISLTLADETAQTLVENAEEGRRHVEYAKEVAVASLERAVKSLRPHHTLRDIGAILGISHQYADQLSKK